jgi:hypothetical protein
MNELEIETVNGRMTLAGLIRCDWMFVRGATRCPCTHPPIMNFPMDSIEIWYISGRFFSIRSDGHPIPYTIHQLLISVVDLVSQGWWRAGYRVA